MNMLFLGLVIKKNRTRAWLVRSSMSVQVILSQLLYSTNRRSDKMHIVNVLCLGKGYPILLDMCFRPYVLINAYYY